MKSTQICSITILPAILAWSNFVNAESVSEFAFNSIPPEAMQAIDTINQSLENRSIPLFDGRALSAGIGALAGVFIYNLLPNTAIVTVTNQLPIMTSAVIGVLVADYLYRQNNGVPTSGFEFP